MTEEFIPSKTRKEKITELARIVSMGRAETEPEKDLVASSTHKDLINAAFSIAAKKCALAPKRPVEPQPTWRDPNLPPWTEHASCMSSFTVATFRAALHIFYEVKGERE